METCKKNLTKEQKHYFRQYMNVLLDLKSITPESEQGPLDSQLSIVSATLNHTALPDGIDKASADRILNELYELFELVHQPEKS